MNAFLDPQIVNRREVAPVSRVLFFIEPFPVRGSPLDFQWVLDRWRHMATAFEQRGVTVHFALSNALRRANKALPFPALAPEDFGIIERGEDTPEERDASWVRLMNDACDPVWRPFIEAILDRTDPQAVLTWTVNAPLREAAAQRQCVVLHQELGPVRLKEQTMYFCDPNGVNAASSLRELWPSVSAAPLNALEGQALDRFLNEFLSPPQGEVEKLDEKLGLAPGKPVLAVFLQVARDSNVLAWSRVRGMQGLLSLLSKAVPLNEFHVLVKCHPIDQVPLEFTRPDFQTVPIDVPSLTLVERADAVMTINSSVGLEGLARGKVVFAFGDSPYSGLGLTRDFADDAGELSASLQTQPLRVSTEEKELRRRFLFFVLFRYLLSEQEMWDPDHALELMARWRAMFELRAPLIQWFGAEMTAARIRDLRTHQIAGVRELEVTRLREALASTSSSFNVSAVQVGEPMQMLGEKLESDSHAVAKLSEVVESDDLSLRLAQLTSRLDDSVARAQAGDLARRVSDLERRLTEVVDAKLALDQRGHVSAPMATAQLDALSHSVERLSHQAGSVATAVEGLSARLHRPALPVRVVDDGLRGLRERFKHLDRAYARRSIDLTLATSAGVTRFEGGLESCGVDPWFALEVPDGRLPNRWTLLEIELESLSGHLLKPKIYFDDGSGMREGSSLALPEPLGGVIRTVIKLPTFVHALRFDPCEGPGRFRLGRLRARELTKAEAALRLAVPVARRWATHPSDAGAAIPEALSAARSKGKGGVRDWAKATVAQSRREAGYHDWLARYQAPSPAQGDAIMRLVASLDSHAFLVVIVTRPGDREADLELTLASLEAQSFSAWLARTVGPLASSRRLHRLARAEDVGAALAESGSGLVAFVRAGETLDENALLTLADAFSRRPEWTMAYSDSDAGNPAKPRFKPDISPLRLLGQDYIGHQLAARVPDLRKAGITSMEELAAHLLAQAHLGQTTIGHVPFVLYHGRCASPAVAPQIYAGIVQSHLKTLLPKARVEPGRLEGTFHVCPPLPEDPPVVSIIIPTRNRADLVRRCIDCIEASTDYPHWEVLVVDNDSDEGTALSLFRELEEQRRARVLRHPGPFNFAAINNAAVRAARGEVLVLLNNDIEIHQRDWLTELVGWALVEKVGAVGCRLLYGDGTLQHAGLVVGMKGLAAHAWLHATPGDAGPLGELLVTREVGAVTAACVAIRRSVFDAVGGFDESLPVGFNDVDLCLRIREKGLSVIYTPFVELLHLESASRGADVTPERAARAAREASRVLSRHGRNARVDPYYSPNLSLDSLEGALAFPPRTVQPWHRRGNGKPGVAILAQRMMNGFGVDVVVAEQAEYFWGRGYDVTVIVFEKDDHYDERFAQLVASGTFRLVQVDSAARAAAYLQVVDPLVAIAHTPAAHEVLALVDEGIHRVFFDHGEPPAHLFPDVAQRVRTRERKVELSKVVEQTVAISEFIASDSGLHRPIVCFNGNDHRLRRRSDLARLAGSFRKQHGLHGFVVLNVARYFKDEREYKGVEAYADVRDAFLRDAPHLAADVHFVIAGRSEAEDRAWAQSRGLIAVSNLSDAELMAAYLDADVYVSMSQWEGCNLGIAEALAMGLPVVASDRGAHGEFQIPTSNESDAVARWIAGRVNAVRAEGGKESHKAVSARLQRLRTAVRLPWKDACAKFEDQLIERVAPSVLARFPPPRRRTKCTTPAISFVILNKDKPELLAPCLSSLDNKVNVPFEALIGDTGSTNADTLRIYSTTPHQVIHLGHYNFSSGNNIVASAAKGRILVFLNNDTELIDVDFGAAVDYLDDHADVGALGAYLVYADKRIQHAGVRICPHEPYRGIPEHFDRFLPIEGYRGMSAPREVVAVTGAMLVVRADDFWAIGGFDEVFEEEAQDMDLCLKLRARGKKSVMHPALLAYHYENSTRTAKESHRDRREYMRRYWPLIHQELFEWQSAAGLA